MREYLSRDLKVLRIQWLAVTAASGTEGGITPGIRLSHCVESASVGAFKKYERRCRPVCERRTVVMYGCSQRLPWLR